MVSEVFCIILNQLTKNGCKNPQIITGLIKEEMILDPIPVDDKQI